MGLLDDAIREHLELKRNHGADPSEIARQEHEALGPVRRTAEPAEPAHSEDLEPHGEAGADAQAENDLGGVDEAWSDRFGQDEASAGEQTQVPAPESAPEYRDEPPYDDAPQAASGAIEVDEPLPPDDRLSQPTTEFAADELHEALHGTPPPAESERPRAPERPREPERSQAPEPPGGDAGGRENQPARDAEEPAGDADQPRREADKPASDADKPAGDAAESGKEAEDVLEETPDFLQETPEHDRLWFEQRPPRDFDF